MTDVLRNKINAYIEWLGKQTNSNGYLDPLYQYQIEAFEEVLGWMDDDEPDTLPSWVKEAILEELNENRTGYEDDYYYDALKWVLALRKPEEK